jgi:hypothetical protein
METEPIVASAEALCELGGFVMGLNVGHAPSFKYTIAFALQQTKFTENPATAAVECWHNSFCLHGRLMRLADFSRLRLRLQVVFFQPSIGTDVFQVASLREFHVSGNFESKASVCGRPKKKLRECACYYRTRCFSGNAKTLRSYHL